MSICIKEFYFPIKLLKSGFMANVKQREEPGFGMAHHKYALYLLVSSVVKPNFLSLTYRVADSIILVFT